MTNEELIEKFESENITLASVQKRAMAFGIDWFIIVVLFEFSISGVFTPEQRANVDAVVSLLLSSGDVVDIPNLEASLHILFQLFFFSTFLNIAYQTFFVWMYGATLGKIAMKIKVISMGDLDKPSFLFALSRASVRIVSEVLFYLGFVWAMMNPKRETWHDKISNTLVIDAE